ncbi:ATP-binding protein [Lawsonibacter sp. LCP25S3_G6]|uniref:ATP-binding protein n=1 Tax=unclassified Lawsonibacter TaxID=2617946 RepID=UPI003F9D0051
MKKELCVKSQSIEISGITKDYKEALCEYIWNGFEANAMNVSVTFTGNSLGGIESVIIQDDGDGICLETIDDTFGTFLASNKNGLSLQLKSKANKGKGRFSCYAFARRATWETVANSSGKKVAYSISINAENKNVYDISEPTPIDADTGTVVTITGIDNLHQEDMSYEVLAECLLKTFAWYLYLNRNKGISLTVNGVAVDFTKYINTEASITKNIQVDGNSFSVTLIVWAEKIRENFCSYYLDGDGILHGKDTTTFNRNTINFNHSVYVKGNFFSGKENISLSNASAEIDGQISLEDTDRAVLRKLKRKIQDIISGQMNSYMAGQADKAISAMLDRKSFPAFGDNIYDQMRKKDLIQVTKEMYYLAPRIFYNLKDVQEKSLLGLLNLLLNTDERENVLSIVESVVELTPTQREEFAVVLKRTKLGNIVDTIKFIEDRYKVIEGLKRIVFDLSNYANERDHVQKIMEQHYWIFGEQYNLVSADQRMQKALESYLYLLYGDDAPDATLLPDQEEMRRMDIFACGARKLEDSTGSEIEENIVVELKAPKIPLTKKVLRQVEDYMDFIRRQPKFNSQHRRWKFFAVCSEVDDDVKSRYAAQEAYGKKGLVTKIENYEIYALTWDDVFKSFELRHSFLLDKLKVDQEAIAAELAGKTGNTRSKHVADAIKHEVCTA